MADEIKTWRLASAAELNLVKTFECGQCFRWNRDENGVYSGIAMGQPARLWEENGDVFIRTAAPEELWRDYFDLGRDYAEISRGFDGGEYLAKCVGYGQGIRILRQEPWEALCSFIISQCNNIKRIKGIVERLCAAYGQPVGFDGGVFYTFPPAARLAALEEQDLAVLRCGYRAAYIITAARAVAGGSLDLAALTDCDYMSAKRRCFRSTASARRSQTAWCCSDSTIWRRFRWTSGSAARSGNIFRPALIRPASGHMRDLPSSTYSISPESTGNKGGK